MDKSNGVKLVVVVVALVAAGAVIAWQMGVFGGGGPGIEEAPEGFYDEGLPEDIAEETEGLNEDGERPLPPMPPKRR